MAASWARAGREGPQSEANLANMTPSRCIVRGSCGMFKHSVGRKECRKSNYSLKPDAGGGGRRMTEDSCKEVPG